MKQKKDDRRSQVIWGLAAFLLPALLFFIVLWQMGFYPFGEKSMLIMDMRDQYVAFFASLRDALFGDDSLFFSWSRSMGGNYWGILTYYIASPLSFITLFFSVENMPVAIELLTILKIGLCGVSFFIFSSYLAEREDGSLPKGIIRPFLVLLSFCYAFMSYNMVYSLSLMWLDGVILLPVILLGIEKLLDGKKGLIYLLALTMLLISNYYTGYMVGLYTGMYMLFRVITSMKKEAWKDGLFKLLRFTLLSLLSIGIAAPVIFGSWKDLTQGKLSAGGTGYSLDLSQTNFESLGDLLGKYTNGNYDSITNSGLPAIYCGYAVLALVIVFFVMRAIRLREKIGMFVILAILCLSLYYTSLDTAWHGFQVPNWFPYRYAFLLGFTFVYMACRAFLSLPVNKKRVPVAGRPGRKDTRDRKNRQMLVAAAFLLLAATSVEMSVNAFGLLKGLDGEFGYVKMADYRAFVDKTKPLVDDVKKDGSFYRINQGYEFSKNDAMLLGYHGMTHYSSTFNAAINSLTPRLGISQGYFWNSGYGSNAMLDSLFAVKYILADKRVPSSYTKKNDSPGGASSYENPFALSIAYASSAKEMSPNLSDSSPFVNQNRLMQTLAGTDDAYFTNMNYNLSQNGNVFQYKLTAGSENPLYLYMRAQGTYYANVFVNDAFVGNYFTNETNGTLFLGNFKQGESVSVRVEASSDENVNLYYSEISELHMEILAPALEKLKKNGMQIENQAGGNLSGKVTVPDGQVLMTSIPYDEGWSVWIDGEKAEAEPFAGTFLAVKCPAGEHGIRLSYMSPGVFSGILVGILSLIMALLYFFLDKIVQAVKSRLAPEAMR